MGTATITCQVCGAVMADAAARFCGRCGADLEGAGQRRSGARDTGARRASRGSRSARVGLALITGVAVVIVVELGSNRLGGTLDAPGGIGAGRGEDSPDPGAADAVVGIGPDTPRSSPVEGADPGDSADPGQPPPIEPGPLRCAPDGCDAWQLPAPSGELAGSAGVLYTLDGDQLSARSGPFGTERWSVSLRELVPVTGDGDPIAGLGGPEGAALVRADPGGVVVVARRAIVRHDREGRRRWQLPTDGWQVWDAVAAGGRHLITRSRSADGSVPFGRVAVLDLDDGSERWTHQVTQIHGHTDELLLAGGLRGEVAAFDLDDGSPLWYLPVSQTAVRVVGPVVHLEPMFPEGRSRGRLLDTSTGETPAHLVGGVLHPPVPVGERVVTVLQGGTTGPDARVVALEPDGSVAWVQDLAAGRGSGTVDAITSAEVYDLDDGSVLDVVVDAEVGAERISLRLRDGAVLARRGTRPPAAPHDTADDGLGATSEPDGDHPGWRTLPGGLALRYDRGELQVRGPDGFVVAVRGPEPTLVAIDPVVVRGGDRLLGLRVGAPG